MNYIVLNGRDSRQITGLLIQSLPPISKPLMRTQVEEIDGRDGDIVTDLGFSAYDKEVSVGLFGNFNINEVIAFFNGQGTVIFSNEPDKFYNYKIIGQIDYERLLRFRTATVTLHVQPFKYPVNEQPVEVTSGDTVTVTNAGNTESAPTLQIYGSGTVNFSLNGNQIMIIELGTDDYITISASEMNAYKDGVLKNRNVTGSYENLVLGIGENTFSWTGTVTRFVVSNYSRWI